MNDTFSFSFCLYVFHKCPYINTYFFEVKKRELFLYVEKDSVREQGSLILPVLKSLTDHHTHTLYEDSDKTLKIFFLNNRFLFPLMDIPNHVTAHV